MTDEIIKTSKPDLLDALRELKDICQNKWTGHDGDDEILKAHEILFQLRDELEKQKRESGAIAQIKDSVNAGLSLSEILDRAFDSFRELVTRFPESRYAEDSRARMQYLVNSLASHEVHVARYYYNRGAYVAAINRAQTAVANFPQAPANEEALFLLVKSYDALGMPQLRDDADRVMQKNFPTSAYFSGGPKSDKPWWQLW